MPGIVVFKRRWSIGSDDMIIPGVFLCVLHVIWLVILAVILGAVEFDTNGQCSTALRWHILCHIVIMSMCVLLEASIACVSLRGTILDPRPRAAIQYLLYIRLGVFVVEIISLTIGAVWIAQNYKNCDAVTTKKGLLGVVVCGWIISLSVFILMYCTFDSAGRSWVKLKRYQASLKEQSSRPGHKRCSGSRRRNWRHSFIQTTYPYRKALREYEQSWDKRCRTLFCCVKEDNNTSSFSEVARLFTEFFRDLDVVPSDILAGLVLLRKEQKQRRKWVVEQQTNEVYQFLSGVPISPATRFLSLRDDVERHTFEDVLYFMHYALAAYGWPMYMMTNTGCGLCKILPALQCCYCCRRGCAHAQSDINLVEDNCCSCNVAALRKLIDLDPSTFNIVYCTYHVDIGETPFFVAVDHAKQKVVIAIRGTLSLQDVLTDLKAEPEPIPIDPVREDWLGHRGMVQAAVYIRKEITERLLLSDAFGFDRERGTDRGTERYELVIVGHSLGAGTAAILAILMQQQFPALHCYAFSPPGGLVSAPCAEETKSFITSLVVGKDVVPRIGLYQLETLRQDLIDAIKRSTQHKWRIISGSMLCCGPRSKRNVTARQADTISPEETHMCQRDCAERAERYFRHPTDSQIALTSHAPLFPPGKIIHVVRTRAEKTRLCGSNRPIYQAVWAASTDFDEVLISPTMINDHMPENVLDALKKVITHASPAKPSRRYTEDERQAMLATSSAPNPTDESHLYSNDVTALNISAPLMPNDAAVVEEHVVPQQRAYLETSFPSVSEPVVDDVTDSSGNYVIPSDDGDDCVQTLSWEFRQGGANYRIHKERLPARPTSFPPKPYAGMMQHFGKQMSLDAGQHAPLATPETLSEASSLTSVNSRGSWFGGQYHRLSTAEVSTLEPILQSPMRSGRAATAHSYDTFNIRPTTSPVHHASPSHRMSPPINWSPVKYSTLSRAIKANTVSNRMTADVVVHIPNNSDCDANRRVANNTTVKPTLHHTRMTSVDSSNATNSSKSLTDSSRSYEVMSNSSRSYDVTSDNSRSAELLKSDSSRLADVGFIQHSPDTGNQFMYDSVLGFYSPAGRGYPHGFCDSNTVVHESLVHNSANFQRDDCVKSSRTSQSVDGVIQSSSREKQSVHDNVQSSSLENHSVHGDVQSSSQMYQAADCFVNCDDVALPNAPGGGDSVSSATNELGEKRRHSSCCNGDLLQPVTVNTRPNMISPNFTTPRIVFGFDGGDADYNCDVTEQDTSDGSPTDSQLSYSISDKQTMSRNNDAHALNNNTTVGQSDSVCTRALRGQAQTFCENRKKCNCVELTTGTCDDATCDDMRDDVSCDSEPFMPQTPADLESPTTSRLYTIIHPSLFLQESQV